MGTDIHLCTEVKLEDGQWYTYGTPRVPRNYEVFGMLAGVRGGDARYPVKGFPDDAGEITRRLRGWWDSDGHTDSYLTSDEIEDFYERWEAGPRTPPRCVEDPHSRFESLAIGYLKGDSWQKKYGLPPGVVDVRWVFWFDN